MSQGVRKERVEVEIDSDLLSAARASGTDISRAAEAGLMQALPDASRRKAALARRWQEENAEAIETLNRYAEESGMLSSRYRRFPWPDSTPT